jgi:glycosyltransferase involved in cell wall biosynthesis
MNGESPEISIVIPVFNEVESLRLVHEELLEQLKDIAFEIIYVDDGSNDGTAELIQGLYQKNPKKITIAVLCAKNGKASAQQMGISYARGRYIVFMDGDGQDDPKDIFHLLKTLKKQDADMIVGWRKKRRSSIFYRFISLVFNFIIRTIISLNIKDINASLKIVRSRFLKDVPIYAGHYRFLPILLHGKGLKVIEKQVHHRKRIAGVTKYTPFKAIGGGLDMFTVLFLMHNNLNPLRFFGGIGLLLICPGFLICCYITYLKIVYGYILDRYPLLLMGILFLFTGMQLMCTGLLAELLVYSQARLQPIPFIKTLCGHSCQSMPGPMEKK